MLLPWPLSLALIPVYLVGPSSQPLCHQRPGRLTKLRVLLVGDEGPGCADTGLTRAHPACLPWNAQLPGPPSRGLSPPPRAPASAGGSDGGGEVCPPLLLPWKQLRFPDCVLQNTRSAYYSGKAGWALSRWAWVGSRHSYFITFMTLATPTPLGTLSPYLFNRSKNPTWQGCCGAQSR